MSKRIPSFQARKKAGGFTLIEFGIVAALLAVAAMGVYTLYNNKKDTSIASNEAQMFTMMAADAQSRFSAQGSYENADAASLVANGIVPNTMVSGDSINTRWNTTVDVTSASLYGNANAGLQFTYSVPAKACSDFVSQAQASAVLVSVAGSPVKDAQNDTTSALDVAALGTACGTSGSTAVSLTISR